MTINAIALDLEETLISDAYYRDPRPGLYEFAEFCCEHFEHLYLYTTVAKEPALIVLKDLVEKGLIPEIFNRKIQYVEWAGRYKDLRFITNVDPSNIVIVDDCEGNILPVQKENWIPIKPTYQVRNNDKELSRIQGILVQMIK